MLQKLCSKCKLEYIVVACQILILATAFFIYLINRGNAYQKDFTWSELELENHVTVQEKLVVNGASASEESEGRFMSTAPFSLDKGIYRIQVDYDTDSEGGRIRVSTGEMANINWNSTPAVLSPNSNTAYVTLELIQPCDEVVIKAYFESDGTLTLNKFSIYETSALYKQNLFHALMLCVVIGFGYYFSKSDGKRRQIILALSGIFLISCYPLFSDSLIAGDDIPFHLLRIEGIAAGLSQRVFPVKIHPVWAQDYGYAVGVFYGDFALYFPALLRLLGFSIQTAFKYFVALMQLATVVVAYFTFKRMFHSEKGGILGSLLYSLSLYRLVDVYTRASVGEFTAMLFFPIVFCGFYLIFMESDRTNWWKHSMITALGLTGLIQSHILSCEMTVLFVVITCVLLIRLVIKPYKFLALASGAVLTLLLNLGFLVPFLSYFNENITIHSSEWTGSTNGAIQDTGLFPTQLFTLFQKSLGGTWGSAEGISNEATFGMGIAFLLGIGVFLYLAGCHHKECMKNCNFKPACFSLGLGCLALWMSTCYFPWDSLAASSPLLDKLIVSVEFPWRMLAPATVLLTFVSCYAFSQLTFSVKEHGKSIVIGCVALLLINAGWYFYDLCFTSDPYQVYDTYELDTMAMYSNDYLPAGTNTDLIVEGKVLFENISIDSYSKMGTKILCHVTAEDKNGFIDFPLNYYEDYHCSVLESGDELEVSAGTNNMVRISVPADFNGSLEISFKEPLSWRISEILSFLTLLGCIAIYGFCIFKEKSLLSKEKLGL